MCVAVSLRSYAHPSWPRARQQCTVKSRYSCLRRGSNPGPVELEADMIPSEPARWALNVMSMCMKFKYEGQSNENWTPATKWQRNLFYSKLISRSVNTFIPPGDETINSSLVERGRSLMDPQPHSLLHFLIRTKKTSTNVLLQVAKNVEVTKAKNWAVRRMLKCFPAKSVKLVPHINGICGRALSCKRMIPFDNLSGRFDIMARRSTLNRQETNHTSLLFFACLHFVCWTNTLYTTLTSKAVKKQLVNLCIFIMHISYPTDGSIDM